MILVLVGLACFAAVVVMAEAGGCGEQPAVIDVTYWALFGGGFVATAAGVYRTLRLGETARAAIGSLVGIAATAATFVLALFVALPECLS